MRRFANPGAAVVIVLALAMGAAPAQANHSNEMTINWGNASSGYSFCAETLSPAAVQVTYTDQLNGDAVLGTETQETTAGYYPDTYQACFVYPSAMTYGIYDVVVHQDAQDSFPTSDYPFVHRNPMRLKTELTIKRRDESVFLHFTYPEILIGQSATISRDVRHRLCSRIERECYKKGTHSKVTENFQLTDSPLIVRLGRVPLRKHQRKYCTTFSAVFHGEDEFVSGSMLYRTSYKSAVPLKFGACFPLRD